MTILVVGASGVVGSAAAAALRDNGCHVVSASRSGELTVDISDESSIHALFESVGSQSGQVFALDRP